MMSRVKIIIIVATVVVLLASAVVVTNHVAYSRWADRVIATYNTLESSNGTPVKLVERPEEIRISRSGGVALLFRPPRTTWPWFAERQPFGDNNYVITIQDAAPGKPPRVSIEHGLE